MPKWENDIDDWIIEAFRNNKRLGRNEIYDYVNQRYKKAKNKTTSLSNDAFDNHLKFLIQSDIVGRHDAGQRGTRIEHFLTQEAKRQLQMGTLDLIALKNKNEKLIKITSQMKQKALYILILMFNHTTSFEFQNKEEIQSFLAPFRLKMYKQSRVRMADENESEEANVERRQFQTIFQSSDRSVTVFMSEYINRYHGDTTNVYNCQIRGMTKESFTLNRIDKPFQYLSFSPHQIDEAFFHLHKDKTLHPVPSTSSAPVHRIVDNDLYFLLFFLEDLYTESVMPILRNIWKYIRNPTPEERKWLTLVQGEIRANKIVIDDDEHRREMETGIRQTAGGVETVAKKLMQIKKIEKINEIESQIKSMQEELNNYMKTYEFIINKHKSLQHIFEIMFPEFLRHLELH